MLVNFTLYITIYHVWSGAAVDFDAALFDALEAAYIAPRVSNASFDFKLAKSTRNVTAFTPMANATLAREWTLKYLYAAWRPLIRVRRARPAPKSFAKPAPALSGLTAAQVEAAAATTSAVVGGAIAASVGASVGSSVGASAGGSGGGGAQGGGGDLVSMIFQVQFMVRMRSAACLCESM